MSDFEDRLSAALTDGAEAAPGVGGLAEGARRRAVVRRRRRVSVAAAAAVVLVAVPVGVLAAERSGPDRQPPVAETTSAADEWTTVSALGVEVDLPADVAQAPDDCDADGAAWKVSDAETCAAAVSVFPGAAHAMTGGSRPGLGMDETAGYVDVGDVVVSVAELGGFDHETARRILASARPAGTDGPGVAEWETVSVGDGVVVDRPVGSGVEVEPKKKLNRCTGVAPARPVEDGTWRTLSCTQDWELYVSAPTQALADVATSSLRPGSANTWRTVIVDEVSLDVPADWSELDPTDCMTNRGAEVGLPRPQTSGIHPCDATQSVTVSPYEEVDQTCCVIEAPGAVEIDEDDLVRVGDRVVVAHNLDEVLRRRVLASARPAGDPAPDAAEWETVEVGGGLVADVPVGGVVQVELQPGIPSCRRVAAATPSVLGEDGRWRGGYCGDVLVEVSGPTQALTDIVTRSVRVGDGPETEPDEWRTVTVAEIVLDVPADWSDRGCAFALDLAFVQPPGSPCTGEGSGVSVMITDAGARLEPHLAAAGGSVDVGEQTVLVQGVAFETARRILASARPVGVPAPDVATWRTLDLGDGITAEVPGAPDVTVQVAFESPACPSKLSNPAALSADGTWRAALCGQWVVVVDAPTQALADLVALQVEGY